MKTTTIAVIVAHYFDVTLGDLQDKTRAQPIVHARHMAMYLARKQGKNSLLEIGRFFKRNHTTVIHAVKSVQDQLDIENPEFIEDLTELRQCINDRQPRKKEPDKDILALLGYPKPGHRFLHGLPKDHTLVLICKN